MSAEDVLVVERIQELFAGDLLSRLDEPDITAELEGVLRPLVEPAFETVMVGPDYTSAELRAEGIEGFAGNWREWMSPFDAFEVELEELVDTGEHVLSLVRQKGRTKTGGIEIEAPAAAVWTLRGGRVCRVEFHLDQDVARRAAGLDPA